MFSKVQLQAQRDFLSTWINDLVGCQLAKGCISDLEIMAARSELVEIEELILRA